MMKTRARSVGEQAISIAMIIAGIVAAGYFYLAVNAAQQQDIKRLEEEIKRLDTEIIAAIQEKKNLEGQRDEEVKKVDARRAEVQEKFENLLDFENQYTNLIEAVEQKARNFNISILGSEYVPPAQASGLLAAYKIFTMRLKVIGDYDRMKHFLWELENRLGRFVKINNFKVNTLSDTEGRMALDLELVTYFKQGNG